MLPTCRSPRPGSSPCCGTPERRSVPRLDLSREGTSFVIHWPTRSGSSAPAALVVHEVGPWFRRRAAVLCLFAWLRFSKRFGARSWFARFRCRTTRSRGLRDFGFFHFPWPPTSSWPGTRSISSALRWKPGFVTPTSRPGIAYLVHRNGNSWLFGGDGGRSDPRARRDDADPGPEQRHRRGAAVIDDGAVLAASTKSV